jgi:gliding motility-associated-like protein
MVNFQFFILSLVISAFQINALQGQELCANGIDDDGDGLVDLNDSLDCSILPISSLSLLPNPSFEAFSCCDRGLSRMQCVEDWIQASEEGSTDYYTGFCGPVRIGTGIVPPYPIPDGKGFVGIAALAKGSSIDYEYAGICMDEPLQPGQNYLCSFFIGFPVWPDRPHQGIVPMKVALFGQEDCSQLPYPKNTCPLEVPHSKWVLLGEQWVENWDDWQKVNVSFRPEKNIKALAIGFSCDYAQYITERQYYLLDYVILGPKEESLPFADIHLSAGHPCSENAILEVSKIEGSQYQWYRNGIAVEGATSRFLSLAPGYAGVGCYQVAITSDIGSHVTRCYTVSTKAAPPPIANISNNLEICNKDEGLVIGKHLRGQSYFWDTGDTTRTITVFEPGFYRVTVTSACEEAVGETFISLSEQGCECFQIPTVFSPNGDEKNDCFSVINHCSNIQDFSLSVYSRWGEKVFSGTNVNEAWDGRKNGKRMPPDVYVYVIIYSSSDLDQKRTVRRIAGDVTLIR